MEGISAMQDTYMEVSGRATQEIKPSNCQGAVIEEIKPSYCRGAVTEDAVALPTWT